MTKIQIRRKLNQIWKQSPTSGVYQADPEVQALQAQLRALEDAEPLRFKCPGDRARYMLAHKDVKWRYDD